MMNKNQNQKRKAQLQNKSKNESFRFQVEFARRQQGLTIAPDAPELIAESAAICNNGLTGAILALATLVKDAKVLGIEPEYDKCSLNGACVPYILGITAAEPNGVNPFSDALPLQVRLAYDNEVRNKVVELAKSKGYETSTRLGQPIIKLPNMVVEVKRVVKK